MNYSIETDRIILAESGKQKSLLLHSCCAPCSSYVLVLLRRVFRITVFYYNPNITSEEEYFKRVEEQRRLIQTLNQEPECCEQCTAYPISFFEGAYEPERFYRVARGLEDVKEGGERCHKCYEIRLRESAIQAAQGGFDYFATTLTISPLKSAKVLNDIGLALAEEFSVSYLVSDFKKKDGFKQSILLSEKYNLYRQNYCGCVYSQEKELRRNV